MGKVKNTNSKGSSARIVSLVLAIISLALGILCFILFADKCTVLFTRILAYVAGALLFALAVMCVCYFAIDGDQKPNFFLFDKTTGRNVSLSELDFNMVNDKMTFYMKLVASDPFELWQSDAMLIKFKNNMDAPAVRAYLPIVIYKMLYDLSENKDVNLWDAFLASNKDVLTFVCHTLDRLVDGELSKVLMRLYDKSRDYSDNIKACLSANSSFFKARMLGYVKRNIDKFY